MSGDTVVTTVVDTPALALLHPVGTGEPVDVAELDEQAVPAMLSVSIADVVDEAVGIGDSVDERVTALDPVAKEAVGELDESAESVGPAVSVLLGDVRADVDEDEVALLADDADRDAAGDALTREDAELEALNDGRCEALDDAVLEREVRGETVFAALGESAADADAVRDCRFVKVPADVADVAAVLVVDAVGEGDESALAESTDAVGRELAAADADAMLSVGSGDAVEVLLAAALTETAPVPDALTLPDFDEVGEAAPEELSLGDSEMLVDAVALTDAAAERDGKDRVGIAERDADEVSLLHKDGCAVFEDDPETADDTVAAADTDAERVE